MNQLQASQPVDSAEDKLGLCLSLSWVESVCLGQLHSSYSLRTRRLAWEWFSWHGRGCEMKAETCIVSWGLGSLLALFCPTLLAKAKWLHPKSGDEKLNLISFRGSEKSHKGQGKKKEWQIGTSEANCHNKWWMTHAIILRARDS